MPRVSHETIEKLSEFINLLAGDARSKCVICTETLIHIVKTAEAQTGAGTATVTRALAEKNNETALPGDQVSGNALNQRVRQAEGLKMSERQNKPETQTPYIAFGEKEILDAAKKIKVEKAAAVTEKKKQAYQERVNAVKETKEIVPPNFILADPPWKYNFSETDARKIENHYDTEDVTCMVDHMPETQPDCILMMWATAPKLKEAFELMKLWKFSYKTCAVWDKEKIGMGYWFRGQHELLLVGVKGNVSPPLEDFRVSSVFRESRTEHSKKPECVYSWIEKAFADKVKLEMYCRNPRDGWQSLGNEI